MIHLYELLDAANGLLFGEPAAQLFDEFVLEPDRARAGNLFVALTGEDHDTHDVIPQAIANGVSGVICSCPPALDTSGVSVVVVKDTTAALMAWAQYVLGRYGTKVIGVAGMAGKSVAVHTVAKILETRYPVFASIDSRAGRLSVPLALAHLKSSDKFAVLNFDPHAVGEMAALVQAAQPDVAVVTSIGDYHTDAFDSTAQATSEMRILTDYLSPSGLAVLNYDDDRVRGLGTVTRAKVRTFSISSFGADVMAYETQADALATNFNLRVGNDRYTDQTTPLLGKYHLYSVLAALSVGAHFGVPLADGLEVVASIDPLPGRMRPLQGKNGSLVIDDSYSANPQSTLGLLNWIESVRKDKKRVFFFFGDMDDLGRNAVAGHRAAGKRAAEVADVLITRGTQAAIAARAAVDYGMDATHVYNTHAHQDAVRVLNDEYQLNVDDVIVVNGGSAARMEQITESLLADAADAESLVRRTAGSRAVFSHPSRLTWIDIDYDAIANNVRLLKERVGERVALMAVVKADAYGHGAVMTARTALRNGATWLGVSSLQEALELRDARIDAPILAMNYTPPSMARQAFRHNVTVTLFDVDAARAYDRIAGELGVVAPIHVKIDTGMGRLGVLPPDALYFFRVLMTLKNLDVEGVFTHFSMADYVASDYTTTQIERFKALVSDVEDKIGRPFKMVHAANSAGLLAYPAAHFDMVRAGIALYGLHPSDDVKLPEGFQPAMTWKTLVAQVKTLPVGHPIGYGNTYITEQEETIAILPVGYGDGFRRAPNNWGEVLIHGQRAPILGRVSMEKTVIRVSHIPQVKPGDEVVLLGKQGDNRLSAEEIAANIGTINYEVTCNALPRVVRL